MQKLAYRIKILGIGIEKKIYGMKNLFPAFSVFCIRNSEFLITIILHSLQYVFLCIFADSYSRRKGKNEKCSEIGKGKEIQKGPNLHSPAKSPDSVNQEHSDIRFSDGEKYSRLWALGKIEGTHLSCPPPLY